MKLKRNRLPSFIFNSLCIGRYEWECEIRLKCWTICSEWYVHVRRCRGVEKTASCGWIKAERIRKWENGEEMRPVVHVLSFALITFPPKLHTIERSCHLDRQSQHFFMSIWQLILRMHNNYSQINYIWKSSSIAWKR